MITEKFDYLFIVNELLHPEEFKELKKSHQSLNLVKDNPNFFKWVGDNKSLSHITKILISSERQLSAELEAERLAKSERREVFVFKAISKFELKDVVKIDLTKQ